MFSDYEKNVCEVVLTLHKHLKNTWYEFYVNINNAFSSAFLLVFINVIWQFILKISQCTIKERSCPTHFSRFSENFNLG